FYTRQRSGAPDPPEEQSDHRDRDHEVGGDARDHPDERPDARSQTAFDVARAEHLTGHGADDGTEHQAEGAEEQTDDSADDGADDGPAAAARPPGAERPRHDVDEQGQRRERQQDHEPAHADDGEVREDGPDDGADQDEEWPGDP